MPRPTPALALLLAACAPEGALNAGTYEPNAAWASRDQTTAGAARGLAARRGEVVVVEGTAALVSGTEGDWGLRVDEARNDVAAVVAAAAGAGADVPGIMVLFTAFEDRGAGGAGYFLPIHDATPGTGREPVEARAAYGATALEGVVNFKSLDQVLTTPRPELFAHELAHRHAAYLKVVPSSTTTVPVLLGRQQAHWAAGLHAEGSFLDGYAWQDLGGGRFRVEAREDRLGSLDLYALGLLPASAVAPFFFIADLRTEAGATIPPTAQLAPGTIARGRRIDLTIEDVIAAVGPRAPAPPQTRIAVVLLTAPGQAIDDPAIEALRSRVDAVRAELEAAWSTATGGRGTLCTELDGCTSGEDDAGTRDAAGTGDDAGTRDAAGTGPDAAPPPPPDPGCDCAITASAGPEAPLLLLVLSALAARRRARE